MKVKIVQADTREIRLFTRSRDLKYGPPDQMNFDYIASLNQGALVQPKDPNSIARLVNLIKCKVFDMDYEFILGNGEEWEGEGTKAYPWIKIKALMDQIKDPNYSHIELFCFLDSDAWIRDETLFLDFCKDFLTRPEHVAVSRDIEVNKTSYLNAGFIAVKNTRDALNVLDTVYNDPEYRGTERVSWFEQTQLSNYQKKHPDHILPLPVNDFNTPCGRIIRHCWTKHLIEHFAVEEALAVLTNFGLQFLQDPRYSLGSKIILYKP
jgi:hypothetical protein